MRFSALAIAGLGPRAQQELKSKGAREFRASRLRNHDVITFAIDSKSLGALANARLVEDFFVEVSRVGQLRNRSDLANLVAGIEPQSMQRMLAAMTTFSRRGGRSYAVFVKQDRDRPLHRKEVSRRLDQEIRLKFPRWRANDPAACEFWVLWNKTASVNLRLTTEAFKYRGDAPSERFGALRPTVAAALVDALDLRAGSRIVDPMCGSGTLLLEANARGLRASGFDKDADAVNVASRRLGDRATVALARDDETFAGYDGLIANVPWGSEFVAVDPVKTVSSWREVPRCVVLAERDAPWRRAFEKAGYVVRAEDRILVRGRWTSVVRADRAKG